MQTRAAFARPPTGPFSVVTIDLAGLAVDQFQSACPLAASASSDVGTACFGGRARVPNNTTTFGAGPARARAANDLSLTTGFHGAR